MQSGCRRAFFAIAFVVLLFLDLAAPSPSWRLVTRVIDSDTVELDNTESIRLMGIDAPEVSSSRDADALAAKECRAFLQGLIGNKKVRLEFDQKITDSFGRSLAYLFLEDGTFVNARIVQEGYSRAYTAYPFRYIQEFRNYERQAQSQARGLWADKGSAFTAVAQPKTTSANFAASSVSDSTIVYVTRTGSKYHRAGCRSLRKSAIPMSLKEAAARYGPCSLYRPPVP